MVERHYGHLAPSYITEVIHAGAWAWRFKPNGSALRDYRPSLV